MSNRLWRGIFGAAYEGEDVSMEVADYMPRVIVAQTQEEAMRQAERFARDNFPEDEGWGGYVTDAVELVRSREAFGVEYEIEGHYGRN